VYVPYLHHTKEIPKLQGSPYLHSLSNRAGLVAVYLTVC
jgi:hypothetical protein